MCTYVLRWGKFLQCTKIGSGLDCLKECYLPYKLSMNFYFSLKVIKEKEQKSKFSKKKQILHQQTKETKELKQLATVKYNYSSSQTGEFHPLLRASRDHSTFQP